MDYEALVHYRVKQFKNEFVNNHINNIENFLWYAKYRLYKFKNIKKDNLLLYLKSVFCL